MRYYDDHEDLDEAGGALDTLRLHAMKGTGGARDILSKHGRAALQGARGRALGLAWGAQKAAGAVGSRARQATGAVGSRARQATGAVGGYYGKEGALRSSSRLIQAYAKQAGGLRKALKPGSLSAQQRKQLTGQLRRLAVHGGIHAGGALALAGGAKYAHSRYRARKDQEEAFLDPQYRAALEEAIFEALID